MIFALAPPSLHVLGIFCLGKSNGENVMFNFIARRLLKNAVYNCLLH